MPDFNAKFEEWLADEDTFIGIFENAAFDSTRFGERIAMPFPLTQLKQTAVGVTRAPDTKTRIGWKYLLVMATTDLEQAVKSMEDNEHAWYENP